MSVTLTLPSYQNFTLQLPKEALLKFFPESLLAQTAQDYGDTFEMTNPLITPEALRLIQSILLQENLPAQPPPDIYLMLPAVHYLNLPVLNLMAEPYYALFRALRPEINLLDIKPVLEDLMMYHQLLKEAISGSAPVLAQYYIENAPDNLKFQSENADIFAFAAYLGQTEIVSVLLRKGINPVTAQLDLNDRNVEYREAFKYRVNGVDNQALHYACLYGNTGVVQVLLASDKITTVTRQALDRARNSDNFITWYVVAINPKTTGEALNSYAQDMDASLIELRVLLSRPEFNPTAQNYIFFREKVEWIAVEVDSAPTVDAIDRIPIFPDILSSAKALYFDPRTEPNHALRALFEKYYVLPSYLTLPWITDARFDGSRMTYWWFGSMVWLWPLTVLIEFLRRFRTPYSNGEIISAYQYGLQANVKYGPERRNDVYSNHAIDGLARYSRNTPEAVHAILEANGIQV